MCSAATRLFQECFYGALRAFQWCFKDVSRKIQGCFTEVQVCFKEVSRVFPECFKGVSHKLHVAWHSSQLPEQKEGLFLHYQAMTNHQQNLKGMVPRTWGRKL